MRGSAVPLAVRSRPPCGVARAGAGHSRFADGRGRCPALWCKMAGMRTSRGGDLRVSIVARQGLALGRGSADPRRVKECEPR